MKKLKIFSLLITLLIFGYLSHFFDLQADNNFPINPLTDKSETSWVDSVFNSLNLDEKIAQLIMIRAYSNRDSTYNDSIGKIIKEYNIGGICFFKGHPVQQAYLTNTYQSIAKTPLFIAIDAEWGLGMRLDSCYSFPRQMTLGAIQDDSLIYQMSSEIARECKQIGVNINFAPVVDINNNPDNPVINIRSFGEDKYNVAQKGLAYMKGLQDNGILATAKHFPGHGDTDTDSHLCLPIINHSKEKIDTLDLYPFKKLINNGLNCIMVAHLYVPAYDDRKNTAATISKPIVTKVLKKQLGFKGLIITDALEMKGVTKYNEPGILEVKALQAGNDILLLPQDISKAVNEIKKAVKNGSILKSDIDEKCKKILRYKYKAGLYDYKPIKTSKIYENLNNPNIELLDRKLYESAITVVKNKNSLLPLKNLDTLRLASVSLGIDSINDFQKILGRYDRLKYYYLPKNASYNEVQTLVSKLSKYNLVIVSINNTNNSPSNNFGIQKQSIDFINLLNKNTKIILDIFANPYSLAYLYDTKNIESIIVSYQDNPIDESISAQTIFGSITAKGKLPVTASDEFPLNTGIKTDKLSRLKYTIPEEVNISSNALKKIDSIALEGIADTAYPGCEILAAKDGKVFYYKSFGYHTYNNIIPVHNTDIYDLASVTKIAATSISIMKLCDEGKIDLDQRISKYLPYLKDTNKGNIVIRDLMTHQAKLESWIPFYKSTLIDGKLDTTIYRKSISDNFPFHVADSLYINKYYVYNIFDSITESALIKTKEYNYSDLGFYFLMKIIEAVSNKPIENYVKDNFYKPLGLTTICYNPLNYFDLSRIVPTENDTVFRKQLIHGYVHDPGAAMLGGISGHAGLFSDANDLAVLMQMLLQNGEYAGKRYIKSSSVKKFTQYQFPLDNNRRGIGFDKPLLEYEDNGPACKSASDKSFGHSGFTGTYVWADPKYNLVYIFLSNRVYPYASNKKIVEMNIRTNIHQIIYDAVNKNKKVK